MATTTKTDTKAPSQAEALKNNDTDAELKALLAGITKKTEAFTVSDHWLERDVHFFQRDQLGKRRATHAKIEHGQQSKDIYNLALALLEQDAELNAMLWNGVVYPKPPPITMMHDGRQTDAAGNKFPTLPPGIVSQIAGQ